MLRCALTARRFFFFHQTLHHDRADFRPMLHPHRILHQRRQHQAGHLRLRPENPGQAGQVPSVEQAAPGLRMLRAAGRLPGRR